MKSDVRDLQTEMRAMMLRQDSAYIALHQAIQRANGETRDTLNAYAETLFQFRGDVTNNLLDIQAQLLQLGELTGQSQRSLAGLRDQLEDQRRQLAARPVPQTETDPAVADDQGASDESDLLPGTADERDEVFNTAVANMNRGNFTVARIAFARFLEEYPDDALAPAAHLRLGELMSRENRFEEAAEEYLKVRERFPTAEEVPEALFRAGAAYLDMENFELARQYLEQVINTYPDSGVATMAQDRLGDIPS